jgi:hypothetical protein
MLPDRAEGLTLCLPDRMAKKTAKAPSHSYYLANRSPRCWYQLVGKIPWWSNDTDMDALVGLSTLYLPLLKEVSVSTPLLAMLKMSHMSPRHVSVAWHLLNTTGAQKTLGMWSCPSGDFGFHVIRKMEEGHLWVERLPCNRCPAADAWMGFRYSLVPKLTYGFFAITVDPSVLEAVFWTKICFWRTVAGPLPNYSMIFLLCQFPNSRLYTTSWLYLVILFPYLPSRSNFVQFCSAILR